VVRSDLIKRLSKAHPRLDARDVEAIVTTFFDEIVRQLAASGRVEIRGFGSFSSRARNARPGLNPRTGTYVEVEAKCIPWFKPSKVMQPKLNPPRDFRVGGAEVLDGGRGGTDCLSLTASQTLNLTTSDKSGSLVEM
jgi:integration host factor subunit beta